MKDLLNDDYSYNYTKFYGKNGDIFTIVGSKSLDINAKTLRTIDTFKTALGSYLELERVIILEKVKEGFMKPVENSEIKTEAPKTIRIKTKK